MSAEKRVKCVVWDLDDTVWDGVALERMDDALPEPKPEVLTAIDFLAEHGVISSVASRTAPSMLERLRADPRLAERFVAPKLSWQDKSVSVRAIASELGIGLDSLVFVDDSAFERSEVRTMVPEVEVLDPAELDAWLATWSGTGGTAESRARARMYREQERREAAAQSFSGTREEFYRQCDMRLRIAEATEADLDRVVELAERTHRLNASGTVPSRQWLADVLADEHWFVPVARLSDVFGDYGLIGAALVRRFPTDATDAWWVRQLTLSCRIAGRGVGTAFLRWLMDRAQEDGARRLAVDSTPTDANTELRVLFRQCGLRVPDDAPAADRTTLWRALDTALPETPSWLAPASTASQPDDELDRVLRDLLAEATGRDAAEIAALPADRSLFDPEIALSSVEGVHLLTAIKQRFGVDIAAEDLNLDALESITSLREFVASRR